MKAGAFFLLLGEADWQLVEAFDQGFLAASCEETPDTVMTFDVWPPAGGCRYCKDESFRQQTELHLRYFLSFECLYCAFYFRA